MTLQQVAEDVRDLLERFADDASMTGRSSYQALVRAFADHCEIVADKVHRPRPARPVWACRMSWKRNRLG